MSLFSHAGRFTRSRIPSFRRFFAGPFTNSTGNQITLVQSSSSNTISRLYRTEPPPPVKNLGTLNIAEIDSVIEKLKADVATIQEECKKKQDQISEIERITGETKEPLRALTPGIVLLTSKIFHITSLPIK